MWYKKFLFSLLMMFCGSKIHAQIYVKPILGSTLSQKTSVSYRATGVSPAPRVYRGDSETLNPLGVALGLIVDSNTSVEAELIVSSLGEIRGENVSAVGVGFNSVYSFDGSGDLLIPWLGCGLIFTRFEMFDETILNLNTQLMLGFDVKLNEWISLSPELRYLFTVHSGNLRVYENTLLREVDVDIKTHTFSTHISLKFRL